MPGNYKAFKQIYKEIKKNKEFKEIVIENVSRLVNLTKIIWWLQLLFLPLQYEINYRIYRKKLQCVQ